MLVQVKRPSKTVSKVDSGVRRMIFGNRQLCMVCKFKPIVGNKFLRTQDKNKPYIHALNCSQNGRF